MITKTVKLGRGEYTDFKDEFTKHDIKFLTGARGAGKSYPCAKYISHRLITEPDKKFIYMRIRDAELATFASWCTDMDLETLAGTPIFKLVRGRPTKGDICLLGYDEDGKQISERIIGKCVSLESSHIFKSGKYTDFITIVFEEYTHLGMNANHEKHYVFNFLENVVSIFRNRKKDIFLLCNNLKTIPLLDTAVDELTGEMFENPIKIKIFRKSSEENKANKFLAYLNGEIYEEDDFAVNISEFFPIYTNSLYVVKQHKIYQRKFYITANKAKDSLVYDEVGFLRLKNFLLSSADNEFYFQNTGVEKTFILDYQKLLAEISKFCSDFGSRYIMA